MELNQNLDLQTFDLQTHAFRHLVHVELCQNLDLQTLDLQIHALRHSIRGIKSKPRLTDSRPIDSCI
jgi:hypothetical protein